MVRTQLYLDDDLHRQLKAAAARQGRTVSDLVREALAHAYGTETDARLETLEGVAALWHDRAKLGGTDAYVRRLRRGTRRRRRLQ
ncbi:MAG: CopG family transcriptional regulator [Gemmatimonadales bacterium]